MSAAIGTREISSGTQDRRPTVRGQQSGTQGRDTVATISVPLTGEVLEGQGSEQETRGCRWRWWLAVFMAGHPSVCP
jgi:hypothetical protein